MSYNIEKLGPRIKVTYTSGIDSDISVSIGLTIESEDVVYKKIKNEVELRANVKYGEGSDKYNSIISELEALRTAAISATTTTTETTTNNQFQSDFSGLDMFNDDAIVAEEAQGLNIDSATGLWSNEEVLDATEYMKKLGTFESSISLFKRVMAGDVTVQEAKDMMTVTNDKDASFDENGVAIGTKFTCSECGKEVDLLLKNGYCSKACATLARAKKLKSSIDDNAQKLLNVINQISNKLSLLDMVLNVITTLPDLIKGIVKLPEEYRDYVMIRIDLAFLEIKRCINIILIEKNNLLIKIINKLKLGTLDSKLQVIFMPILQILTVIAQVQNALNVAIAVVMKVINVPITGIPPQSYGWAMTLKSAQYAETAGKLFIEIVPKMDTIKPLPNRMNNILQSSIDAITKVSLPPILEFEYFEPPEAFKIRYALSQDNTPRLKKLQEMLEALVVMGCDTFPRYKRLKLTNVWFVLSILTGWGPLSRGVYGDFIFHGTV